ncbi:MAG TPA: PqqD family protein [Ktedonobacterales bacterium]
MADNHVDAMPEPGGEEEAATIDERLDVRRRADVETEILPDGSCVLFDPATNTGHALNASGALIWDCCDGTQPAGAIADELADLLPGEPQLRNQALEMIASLLRMGLVLPVE